MLKNNEISILIKMENLIGMNEKRLFGRKGNKKCVVKWYDDTETIITKDDFLDFMALIEKEIKNKKKSSDRTNKFNKDNREYHRIMNNLSNARKNNDIIRIEKYSKMLEDLKNKKN